MATTTVEQKRYSTADVAEMFGVSVKKVLRWIDDYELLAVNIALRADRKPIWRISEAAIDAFERKRSTQPPDPKPARGRKEKRTGRDWLKNGAAGIKV